jgi:hypothetical protein
MATLRPAPITLELHFLATPVGVHVHVLLPRGSPQRYMPSTARWQAVVPGDATVVLYAAGARGGRPGFAHIVVNGVDWQPFLAGWSDDGTPTRALHVFPPGGLVVHLGAGAGPVSAPPKAVSTLAASSLAAAPSPAPAPADVRVWLPTFTNINAAENNVLGFYQAAIDFAVGASSRVPGLTFEGICVNYVSVPGSGAAAGTLVMRPPLDTFRQVAEYAGARAPGMKLGIVATPVGSYTAWIPLVAQQCNQVNAACTTARGRGRPCAEYSLLCIDTESVGSPATGHLRGYIAGLAQQLLPPLASIAFIGDVRTTGSALAPPVPAGASAGATAVGIIELYDMNSSACTLPPAGNVAPCTGPCAAAGQSTQPVLDAWFDPAMYPACLGNCPTTCLSNSTITSLVTVDSTPTTPPTMPWQTWGAVSIQADCPSADATSCLRMRFQLPDSVPRNPCGAGGTNFSIYPLDAFLQFLAGYGSAIAAGRAVLAPGAVSPPVRIAMYETAFIPTCWVDALAPGPAGFGGVGPTLSTLHLTGAR